MDDLISREAAIKALCKAGCDSSKCCAAPCDDVRAVEALPSVYPKWIPFKTRPMTEEERNAWSEAIGYDAEYDEGVIYTSPLPDDGQQVLVCSKWGDVWVDVFTSDPDYGCGLDEHEDLDGVTAWMPLPKPLEREKEQR